jgi:hypothetical protein
MDAQLILLRFYLENLLASLPIPAYGFSSFKLDPEWVTDDVGEVGSINRELKVSLGLRKEPLKLKEQG